MPRELALPAGGEPERPRGAQTERPAAAEPERPPGAQPERPAGAEPRRVPPAGAEPDRTRLAAEALARARADALARGAFPSRPPGQRQDPVRQRGAGPSSTADGRPGGVGPSPPPPGQQGQPGGPGRPGRRERRDDPAPLVSAIDGLIAETGWELAVATGSVFGRWPQIVGPDLAAHTAPDGLAGGELTVTADSTAWATQLRLLAAELIRALNAELGPGTVRRVKVLGPGAQSRRAGEWRVRGSRGPRDTYG